MTTAWAHRFPEDDLTLAVRADDVADVRAQLAAADIRASVVSVPDEVGTRLMTAFHRELAAGVAPAQALVRAQAKVLELAATLEGADAKALRETMDKLKDKLGSAAIVLASVSDGKVTLIAGVTSDLTAKVKAGDLVNHVAKQVGGKGGGRPDMAQAGGTDAAALPKALPRLPSAWENSLGITKILFAWPCASCGSICRYW